MGPAYGRSLRVVPLPPKLVRRVTTVPLFMFVALAAMAIAPIAWLVALVIDLPMRHRWKLSRFVGLAFVWAFAEVVGILALFLLWVVGGFSLLFHLRIFEDIHYAMLGIWMNVMVWVLRQALGIRIEYDHAEPIPHGAALIFARHAGPADSLLLVNGLLGVARRPRIVAKAALQWDPFVDVAANRVFFHFVDHRQPREAELANIAQLAATMGDDGAFLLFPEGGNFTEGRREKAITSLERKGLDAYAEAARDMPHLLPPRPNGALTALEAAPDASVVMLGHTGLEDVQGPKDIWSSVPFDEPVHVRTWVVPPSGRAPADDREAQIEWLFRWWATVDRWIGTYRAGA